MSKTAPAAPPAIGIALTVETLARLRDWVFEDGRDVELQDFYWPETLSGDWRPLAERGRELLRGHEGRRGLHGPFWGLPLDSVDPEIVAVVRRRMGQALDVCEVVGADQMVVHSPFTTWGHNNPFPGRDALVEQTLANMAPVVRRAEDQGVTLVIENIEDKDPAARVSLAKAFASERVRVSLDTGHAHYAHGSTGAPPVDHYVAAAGEMLEHVHVQDADGYGDRHWPPGEGTILWGAVFSAIGSLPRAPRLLLEVHPEARATGGAEWLIAKGLAR